MNREILFRAETTDDGTWVEGSFIHAFQEEKKSAICGRDREVYFIAEMSGKMYTVKPETVCQYTGLTDKNGRRYEGDIFQASDGDYIQRYVITWNEDSLEWSAECMGNPEGTLPLSEFKVEEIEVIGNIFDNPELLEGVEG